MSIESPEELVALQEVGHICALALRDMKQHIRPGMTTAQLAEIGAKVMRANSARSAPALVYGLPAEILISVNDEAVHGIPGPRRIETGDLVKLDVTFEKGGFMGDAAITVPVAPASGESHRLARCAERAFQRAMRVARAGNRISQIGREVEREVKRSGFSVIRELAGHGIGRTIHEPPSIPNFEERGNPALLTAGLVITVEPIIAAGVGRTKTATDGWTECTVDGSFAAHFEHTLVITATAPILLTAA
jgi:methionyl aminopeptidase